jgi:hypothetical protein
VPLARLRIEQPGMSAPRLVERGGLLLATASRRHRRACGIDVHKLAPGHERDRRPHDGDLRRGVIGKYASAPIRSPRMSPVGAWVCWQDRASWSDRAGRGRR